MSSHIWEPDTCGCALEVNYNPAKDLFTYIRSVKVCAEHAALEGLPLHYDLVLKENRGKNYALQNLMDAMPELTETVATRDGPVTRFIPGKEPTFSYVADKSEAERKLVMTVEAADLAKLVQASDAITLDTKVAIAVDLVAKPVVAVDATPLIG